jgi:single-stranded-DNA-specific exonuclease
LRWILPDIDPDRVRELSATLRIRALTARVLLNRGITDAEAALRYLRPSLDHLYDPFLLAGMHDAVARLQTAIANREKILIYGDYDVDGTISVVILKKAIELAGGQADFHVPHRLKDGYGMRTEVIEEAARRGVNLIISVDTGIRALEVVRAARELGIDVVVTDHHLPEAELPPALAVLNPNRPGCAYPEKNLCGAGVAFKLVQALLGTLDWTAEKRNRMLRSFLKLVAIATVADVVPLTGENRVIVKHGLDGLDRVNNPGLRALLDVAGLGPGKRPTAEEVAFRVAPRINAAGRMAHAANVIHMFLTDSLDQARSFAQELHDLNHERQQTEAEMVRTVLEICVTTPVTGGDAALVFSGANWHRGVVGIVASRLVDRFCRPVFVLGEEDGQAQGSGRSISAFHLLDALESMPDLFTRFGGHRQAAGLSMSADRVPEFRDRFNAYAAARLTADDFVPQISIDAVLELQELDETGIAELLSLAPFGFGNPTPLLAATGAESGGPPAPIKEKHLRVHLRQNGRRLVANAWNFAARAAEVAAGNRIDVAFSVEEDSFALSQGWPGWSLTLKDVRAAAISTPCAAG